MSRTEGWTRADVDRILHQTEDRRPILPPLPRKEPPRERAYSRVVVTSWCREYGLPMPAFEVVHIPNRKFAVDIAWPEYKVGIEVQGGLWIVAAHSTATGIKRDMEKRNLGLCEGWRVLECEPKELLTAKLADLVKRVIEQNRKAQV